MENRNDLSECEISGSSSESDSYDVRKYVKGIAENFSRNGLLIILGVIVLSLVISLVGVFISSQGLISTFGAVSEVLPFIILAILTYFSCKYPGLKILTTIWLYVVVLMLAAVALIFGIFSLFPADMFSFSAESISVNNNIDPSFIQGAALPILLLMVGVLLGCLVSLIPQFRVFRLWVSRYLPIDPDSFVHKTALSLIIAVIALTVMPLLVLGYPPLLSPIMLEMMSQTMGSGAGSMGDILSIEILSFAWIIIGTFIAAGLFVCRSFPQVMDRLGLKVPTLKEFVLAVVIGAVLVVVFSLFSHLLTFVFTSLGLPVTDEKATTLLFAAYLTPLAALIASISAGFGEEIAVRGLLQEKFGILLSAIFFASLHALQYNWDGVITVLIIGIIFGLLRQRYHTTFSAITHTVYDLILFNLLILGISL